MVARETLSQNDDKRCSDLLHKFLLWSNCEHVKDNSAHTASQFCLWSTWWKLFALMCSKWRKTRRGRKVFFSLLFFEISSNQRTPPACRHFPLPPSWPGSRRINKTSAKALSLLCFNICASFTFSSSVNFYREQLGELAILHRESANAFACERMTRKPCWEIPRCQLLYKQIVHFSVWFTGWSYCKKEEKSWTNGHSPEWKVSPLRWIRLPSLS